MMANSSPPRRASVSPDQKVRQAAGHLLDEIVAGRMPVGIVDVLEAVEVEEVDGDAALHPAEADLVIEPLGKDQAVRQAERVAADENPRLFLALGEVPGEPADVEDEEDEQQQRDDEAEPRTGMSRWRSRSLAAPASRRRRRGSRRRCRPPRWPRPAPDEGEMGVADAVQAGEPLHLGLRVPLDADEIAGAAAGVRGLMAMASTDRPSLTRRARGASGFARTSVSASRRRVG